MRQSIEAPIFLVGAERSGTTMLNLMLKHHTELAWAGEMNYITEFISDSINSIDMEGYYKFLEFDRIFKHTYLTIDRTLNYSELAKSFLNQHRVNQNKPLIGATVHISFHLLPIIWPQAKFIHILRDGRDVARSCIRMGWAGNYWTGSTRWLEAENQWVELKENIDPDKYMEIRYEELLAAPKAELTKICEFIGLEYCPSMLRYDENSTYSKPDINLAYQWKHKLSEKEIRLCESRINSQLLSRGYELSGLAPLNVSTTKELVLRVHDRLSRVRFHAKQHGWLLVILGAIMRRSHIPFLENYIRIYMQNKAQSNLK